MSFLCVDATGSMGTGCDSYSLEGLEEPFFSKKLSLLIEILYEYRLVSNFREPVFSYGFVT